MPKFRFPPRFVYDPPPRISDELPGYLSNVFVGLSAIVNSPIRNFPPQKEEPAKPVDGDLLFADGTNWDPGDGRGFYYYDSGWVKL